MIRNAPYRAWGFQEKPGLIIALHIPFYMVCLSHAIMKVYNLQHQFKVSQLFTYSVSLPCPRNEFLALFITEKVDDTYFSMLGSFWASAKLSCSTCINVKRVHFSKKVQPVETLKALPWLGRYTPNQLLDEVKQPQYRVPLCAPSIRPHSVAESLRQPTRPLRRPPVASL